jgi:hypothetical protein
LLRFGMAPGFQKNQEVDRQTIYSYPRRKTHSEDSVSGRDKGRKSLCLTEQREFWIPAFAGMTDYLLTLNE